MKTYEITEEQIKELSKTEHGKRCTKKWFPEVFETKLQVDKWIKYPQHKKWMLFITKVDNDKKEVSGYGFDCNGVFMPIGDTWSFYELTGFVYCADSEVLEALKNEAIKRGFKEGVYVDPPSKRWLRKIKLHLCEEETDYIFNNNELLFCGVQIFYKGKWATTIPTYTKEEAEKMLNAKIV